MKSFRDLCISLSLLSYISLFGFTCVVMSFYLIPVFTLARLQNFPKPWEILAGGSLVPLSLRGGSVLAQDDTKPLLNPSQERSPIPSIAHSLSDILSNYEPSDPDQSGSSFEEDSLDFRDQPIPPESIPLPSSPPPPMSRRYMVQPEKPDKFGGEKEEDVDEFLVTMEMYLRSIHIPEGTAAEIERYKLVLLHKHLTGRANVFWYELNPTRRATYASAATELRPRFPTPNHEVTRLDTKNRAISEMNNLSQGTRTSEEYAEYVQELHAQLGEEYEVSLATRFIDGISSEVVQIQVDGHLRGVYTPFSEVIRVYLGCTTTLRRKEAVAARDAALGAKKDRDIEVGTGYEQMMRQMGEMFKNCTLGSQNVNQSQMPQQSTSSGAYQPIVGSVSQGSIPRSTPYQGQRDFRPRGELTCFRCGGKGHRAYECVNSPLPREEQDRLRNEFARTSGARYPPQVVATVEVSHENDDTDPVGMMMMSANLVEAFTGENDEVRQLKQRVAYLEAAMAEKRGRTGDTTVSDEPSRRRLQRGERSVSPTGSRSQPQNARIRSPLATHTTNGAPQPGRPLPNAVRMDAPEQTDSMDGVVHAPGSQPFIPDPYFANPEVYSQFIPTATVPKARKKRGPPKPKRHIKMVQGQSEWNPVEMLKNIPVTGLSMATLLDIAPTARIAVIKALQLDSGDEPNKRQKAKARGRVGRNVEMVDETEVYAITGVRDKIQGVMHGVLPEPKVRFFNFHTMGDVVLYDTRYGKELGREVKRSPLDKILIDGGAVVNLMPEEVARRLKLTLTENSDILIRTATNEIRCVKYCTKFDVCIAGVTATITVHVLDIPQSYSLLLGRRWLYQVRAIGDYASHSYTIYDAEGVPHQMMSIAGAGRGPDVLLNPDGGPGLTDQEKEEIEGQERMQALLARATSEAKEQLLEYEEDYGDDEEDEEDEEGIEGRDTSDDELPKEQRQ